MYCRCDCMWNINEDLPTSNRPEILEKWEIGAWERKKDLSHCFVSLLFHHYYHFDVISYSLQRWGELNWTELRVSVPEKETDAKSKWKKRQSFLTVHNEIQSERKSEREREGRMERKRKKTAREEREIKLLSRTSAKLQHAQLTGH